MTIKEKLEKDLEKALRENDFFKRDALRFLLATLQNKEIEARGKNKVLEETEIIDLLRKEAKKRMESFNIYQGAGRNDLASKEKMEADLILSYLPQEMSDEELSDLINAVIKELGVNSLKEMGKVIQEVAKRASLRASPSRIATMVKEKLS